MTRPKVSNKVYFFLEKTLQSSLFDSKRIFPFRLLVSTLSETTAQPIFQKITKIVMRSYHLLAITCKIWFLGRVCIFFEWNIINQCTMPFLAQKHKASLENDAPLRYSYFECTRDHLVQHRFKIFQSQPNSEEDHRKWSLGQESSGNYLNSF